MPKKPSKVFIEQLYNIYRDVKFGEEIIAEFKNLAPEKEDKKEPENIYEQALEVWAEDINLAVGRKADIDRIYQLSQQDNLSENEETELSETYKKLMEGFSKEEPVKQEKFNNTFSLDGYRKFNYTISKDLYKEAAAFDAANNLVKIASMQKKVENACEKYAEWENDYKAYNAKKEAFFKKYMGKNLNAVKAERAVLEGMLSALNEKEIGFDPVEEKEKIEKQLKDKKAALDNKVKECENKITYFQQLEQEKAGVEKLIVDYLNEVKKKDNIEIEIIKAEASLEDAQKKLNEYSKEDIIKFEEVLAVVEGKDREQELYNYIIEYKNKKLQEGKTIEEIGEDKDVQACVNKFGYDSLESFLASDVEKRLEKEYKAAWLTLSAMTHKGVAVDQDVVKQYKETVELVKTCQQELENIKEQMKKQQQVVDEKNAEKEAAEVKFNNNCKNAGLKTNNPSEAIKEERLKLEQINKDYINAENDNKKSIETYNEKLAELEKHNKKIEIATNKINESNDIIAEAEALFNERRNLNKRFVKLSSGVCKRMELNTFEYQADEALKKSVETVLKSQVQVKDHKNSDAYTAMIQQLNDVINATDIEERKAGLANIRDYANEYIRAKNDQFRPFPSNTRKARLEYAKALVEFANNSEATMSLWNGEKNREIMSKIADKEKEGWNFNVYEVEFADKLSKEMDKRLIEAGGKKPVPKKINKEKAHIAGADNVKAEKMEKSDSKKDDFSGEIVEEKVN